MEALFRTARKNGRTNGMTMLEVNQKVRVNGSLFYMEENDISFYPNGNLREGILGEDAEVVTTSGIIRARRGQQIVFWDDGSLRECVPADETTFLSAGGKPVSIHSGYQWDISNRLGSEFYRPTRFHRGGAIREGVLAETTRFEAERWNFVLEGMQPTAFHENGTPASGFLGEEGIFAVGETEFRFTRGYQVILHSDGIPRFGRIGAGEWVSFYHPKPKQVECYPLEKVGKKIVTVSDSLFQIAGRDLYLPSGSPVASEEGFSFLPSDPNLKKELESGN